MLLLPSASLTNVATMGGNIIMGCCVCCVVVGIVVGGGAFPGDELRCCVAAGGGGGGIIRESASASSTSSMIFWQTPPRCFSFCFNWCNFSISCTMAISAFFFTGGTACKFSSNDEDNSSLLLSRKYPVNISAAAVGLFRRFKSFQTLCAGFDKAVAVAYGVPTIASPVTPPPGIALFLIGDVQKLLCQRRRNN
jgi:hypothetical protein